MPEAMLDASAKSGTRTRPGAPMTMTDEEYEKLVASVDEYYKREGLDKSATDEIETVFDVDTVDLHKLLKDINVDIEPDGPVWLSDPVVLRDDKGQRMVVLSETHWNSIQATMELMSDPRAYQELLDAEKNPEYIAFEDIDWDNL